MRLEGSTDVVVVGGGVAGLTVALALAPLEVTLLTKGRFGKSSASVLAQGGVAAAVGADDGPEHHARDTLKAGVGHCNQRAVKDMTAAAPEVINSLLELGVRFDRLPKGSLDLGREGAHSRNRVLHADGDATGAELVRALGEALRRLDNVTIREEVFVQDLLVEEGWVVGVSTLEVEGAGRRRRSLRARAVVLATGGLGQVYLATTNPRAATGDGVAMAARAGALLADLEFVQFHPTALDVGLDPMPLMTEALRGEGAVLRDANGREFMTEEHELGDLAPRDVVARAIWKRISSGETIFLDARETVGQSFPARFPTVFEHAQEAGLDPRRDLLPVSPAAHYAMGGVVTDLVGRTSLPGLWACGEVACTGVHGANRLASNSLLEGMVFGALVARDIADGAPGRPGMLAVVADGDDGALVPVDRSTYTRQRIREIMWSKVGLERDRRGLAEALGSLDELQVQVGNDPETRNLLQVARLVSAAAFLREESRGAHKRVDWPSEDPAYPGRISYRAESLLANAGAEAQGGHRRKEAVG